MTAMTHDWRQDGAPFALGWRTRIATAAAIWSTFIVLALGYNVAAFGVDPGWGDLGGNLILLAFGTAVSLLLGIGLKAAAPLPLRRQLPAAAAMTVVAVLVFEPSHRLLFSAVNGEWEPLLSSPRRMLGLSSYWLLPLGLCAIAHLALWHRAEAQRRNHRLAELKSALDDLRRVSQASDRPEIWAERAGQHVRIPLDAIDWIEADRDYVHLHAEGQSAMLRETLSGLHERLGEEMFLRVRRSALVRIDRIATIRRAGEGDYRVTLAGGDQVRVGRTYLSTVRRLLARRGGVDMGERNVRK